MKFEPEHFIVDEVPLYEPSGTGIHTFFAIRKRNLDTLKAINKLAQALQVSPRQFGYAGLKDKNALTTQVLSVEGVSPEQVLALALPAIEVLWAERHSRKLRVGQLRGNRFEITLCDVSPRGLLPVKGAMARLATEGVPNRFGAQRFGNKQNTHLIGKALLKAEWETVVHYLFTDDTAQFSGFVDRAKQKAERGALEKAVGCIPHRLRKLFLSAYQAYLFNAVLKKRLPNLGRLLSGDIAVKHSNGAPFLVENAKMEQRRADVFEISPSGPIFGYKMRQPVGVAQALEAECLAAEGVDPEAFRTVVGIRLPGARRSLRMPMVLHQVTTVDVGLRLCFTLPPGGYATVVLDELKRHL